MSDFYNPVWWMEEGVVMVVINYRLGPLGFLTTGDSEIPPNLGLWDQVHLVSTCIFFTTTAMIIL